MDHQRFLSLFERHQHDLHAFVLSMVRDWDKAEDIVQDVALVLWRRADSYDPTYSFGAWTRGIAAKELLKNRYRRRCPGLPGPEAMAAVQAAFDQAEPPTEPRLEALRRCLHRLDGHARTLIDFRYRDQLPLAEVAQRSGRTVTAVTQALLRLRAALERCVRLGQAPAEASHD